MNIPRLARYNGTVSNAYKFVEDYIEEFPINPFELIKNFGWGLLTYEEMTIKDNCTIEDVCECLGTDGYSIYNGNNYTIAYNNTIQSYGRINFTLAHEIGHIILNHHKDFNVTSVLEDNFTKEEYKILENEANCFARNILAPAPLVQELGFLGMLFKIPKFFAITPTAATTRISLLKHDLYYLNDKQISNFNSKYKRSKCCNNCSTDYLDLDTKYCPICGNNKLLKGDIFSMKEYKGKNIENECPRCENFDIHDNDIFCKICGLELKNSCSSCAAHADTNARYCTKCGAETIYFRENLLDDWQITTDVVEKTPELVTSDDDLPF